MSPLSIAPAAGGVLNRHSDVGSPPPQAAGPVLPPVDWAAAGLSAPVPLPMGARRLDDPLPLADVVVLTWTSAEWEALDHVFVNSARPSDPANHDWKMAWLPYARGSESFAADPKSGALWGVFRLVSITDQSGRPWRVLLFKSNSHLAHPPWVGGLAAMLRCIMGDAKPDRIYTIGTAGGARLDQCLGDSVVTNAAMLDLQRPQNTVDRDNGSMYRCPTWFPSTSLFGVVEEKLLYKMNQLVTTKELEGLFAQLKAKHPGDPLVADMTLGDLVNDAINPVKLGSPKIQALKDVPLLSTDFYYIAKGDSADAYAFLEMDDAIIAREANSLGVRFLCARNISDPVVPGRTKKGVEISAGVRADWSGLIYTTFGLLTSFNGALAAWATISGEGRGAYNPKRETPPPAAELPLEVKLAYQVRSCGTCSFFWPDEAKKQPYGPYTAFDFDVNVPYPAVPEKGKATSAWVTGRTRPPSFPNGEIVDGCRKAPIMTIGINPNLTAFLPGQTGAAWCYPNFSSDNDTDAWTKYAWYYRYRSVFQERLTLDFARRFILPEGRVLAPRGGHVVSTQRLDDSPAWTVTVRYDGDPADTVLSLPGVAGDFPYVLLFDAFSPTNVFAAGDVIAGRIAVPQGIQVDVLQQQQGYYMQFVPVLQKFEESVRGAGHPSASFRVGEDVSQLDMVACASPHWNTGFLGGTNESVAAIVDNCVSKNAWAIKQMVQTRPAVLYVVSISSWEMFYGAFGAHLQRDIPLSSKPADNDFTLLSETTDPEHPAYIVFNVTVGGMNYSSRTRLVITPHFSYNTNFLQQFRLSPAQWTELKATQQACVAALTPANGFTVILPDPKHPANYVAIQLSSDPDAAARSLDLLKGGFPSGYEILRKGYYDPHTKMAAVLEDLYSQRVLAWKDNGDGTGYLDRTEGSCQFCSNTLWQFPNECRYGKTSVPPPPPGFLEKVAEQIVKTGRPS